MYKKHIITGAAGTGKSALLKGIESQGVTCIAEISRQVIIKEQQQNNKGTPWQNIERFTYLVFQQTQHALEAQPNALFCDRSLVDNIAYLKYHNKAIPTYLQQFNFKKYYHKTVFFIPPWEKIYENDPQRPEDFQTQVNLSKVLRTTYLNLGFRFIEVPLTSINHRISFVWEQFNKLNTYYS